MKSIISFILRSLLSFTIAIFTWPIAFWGFDLSFWMSSLLAILGGGVTYHILKWRANLKLLKKNQLTRKEFQYITRNLKEAKVKIKRFNKAMLGVRSFRAVKQLGNLQKIVKQIYQIVNNEPKRFYQAERFFFYHLDSVVELTERYVFLARQSVNDMEVRQSLSETERTLEQLQKSLDDDLLVVLSNDIDTLNFELDVAKKTHQRNQSFFEMDEKTSEQNNTTETKNQNLLENTWQPEQFKATDKVHRDKSFVTDERRKK